MGLELYHPKESWRNCESVCLGSLNRFEEMVEARFYGVSGDLGCVGLVKT